MNAGQLVDELMKHNLDLEVVINHNDGAFPCHIVIGNEYSIYIGDENTLTLDDCIDAPTFTSFEEGVEFQKLIQFGYLRAILDTIHDDGLCISFQSIGEYRSYLIKAIGLMIKHTRNETAESKPVFDLSKCDGCKEQFRDPWNKKLCYRKFDISNGKHCNGALFCESNPKK